jgi:hypothetical protein
MGMKLVANCRSTDPMIYRARLMSRLEIRPRGYLSSARKGGGVEQDRTRTQTIPEISGWRTRPNFLAKFFWEKILEIKIVLLASPRRGC